MANTVKGNLTSLNDLARQAQADHIIHTGHFGFYDIFERSSKASTSQVYPNR
ncbi:hypothetical protein LX32DRAFT_633916 [Colletotrichum zoysiae]|uniref:Uncharacterized protein n=1 Tax=Colletotrichum zoysiae TaxID=1216348 RepID=A0AAD9HTE5_9PEZI|nr:hypothetical protein LX32DRAFT_633916 [Colletotrichum zoysiae]